MIEFIQQLSGLEIYCIIGLFVSAFILWYETSDLKRPLESKDTPIMAILFIIGILIWPLYLLAIWHDS